MCRAKRGGRRTPSRAAEANLDCKFVENALGYVVPNIEVGARAPLDTQGPLRIL